MATFKVNQFCSDHDLLHVESRDLEDLLRSLGKTSIDDKNRGIAQFTLRFAKVTFAELMQQIKQMRFTSNVTVNELSENDGEIRYVQQKQLA